MLTALSLAAALTVALSSSVKGQQNCPCSPYKDEIVCADPSLTSIPACVPSDIPKLRISTPSIPLVPETLQRFTSLVQLAVTDFDGPIISHNFLLHQHKLKTFIIWYTDLDYVDNRWFMYAPELTHVGLAFNNITSFPEDTFRSLPKLTSLGVDDNLLNTLPTTLFEGTSLTELFMDKNNWHCECELMKLMQWLWDHDVTLKHEAVCYQPLQLRGLRLRDLTVDLACKQ